MRRAATDLCCDRLADEAAILACAMYADLNPIRARLADTPETSEFASACDRIKARRAEMLEREDREAPTERIEADQWLAPVMLDESPAAAAKAKADSAAQEDDSGAPADAPEGEAAFLSRPPRASDKGFPPITREEHLALLDWTGRELPKKKRGAIPADLAPILERLEIRPERFVDAAGRFGELFHGRAGREDRVARLRERAGRRRFPGRRQCQAVFSSA